MNAGKSHRADSTGYAFTFGITGLLALLVLHKPRRQSIPSESWYNSPGSSAISPDTEQGQSLPFESSPQDPGPTKSIRQLPPARPHNSNWKAVNMATKQSGKSCGYQDCSETILPWFELCAPHNTAKQKGEIDQCPNCGQYKDTKFPLCRTCNAVSRNQTSPSPRPGQVRTGIQPQVGRRRPGRRRLLHLHPQARRRKVLCRTHP